MDRIFRTQLPTDIGAVASPYRNKLINGDFDIWQRGTSIGLTTTAYGGDRWKGAFAGAGFTITHSRQAFTLGQIEVPGNPKYFARMTVTTPGSLTVNVIEQWIEGAQTLSGRPFTLTFYMKGSSSFTLDTANSLIYQYFGTGGSPSSTVSNLFSSFTVNDTAVTTNWKKFTISGTFPSITGKVLGSNGDDALRVAFSLPITSGISVDIAHVSIVEGDATKETDPFSGRHRQNELTLCQRYYEAIFLPTGQFFGIGQAYSVGAVTWSFTYQNKRVAPSIFIPTTLQLTDSTGINGASTHSISAALASSRVVSSRTSSGLVAGNAVALYASADSTITIDAEL